MADSRDNQYKEEDQYRKDHLWTGEDFASCASANANYCYQMSLWWWNTYKFMYNLHATTQPWASQFAYQSCECAERSLIEEDDCECCQHDGGSFEPQRHQMNPCKDCPPLYPGPPRQRLQEEYSSRSENRRDLRSRQNKNSNKDNSEDNDVDHWPGGNEDCNDRIDDDDDDIDDDNDDDFDDKSSDNDEDSDMKMEVDDDFRKFLEQSEKHRQERERRKQEILQAKDEYIEVGSIHLNTTTHAPSEQPGAKRKAEMQELYGKHASAIMSLEASLQLNYDKNCDLRQPTFWPSIPLKF